MVDSGSCPTNLQAGSLGTGFVDVSRLDSDSTKISPASHRQRAFSKANRQKQGDASSTSTVELRGQESSQTMQDHNTSITVSQNTRSQKKPRLNIGEAMLGKHLDVDEEESGKKAPQHWLIDHYVFTSFIGILVLLNTVQMGVEVDSPDWWVWPICEHIFTGAFVAEAALKIFLLGGQYFEQSWNVLDFSLAGLSVVDTWVLALISSDVDLQQLSVLRILRLVRLVRVVRLMKNAQQMVLVITGVIEAMQTTCWIGLVLCICVYIFGIFFTKIFGKGDVAEGYPGFSTIGEEIDEQEIMANYNPHLCFGSLWRSILTLFNMAILAEWTEIVRPIAQRQPGYLIFLIIFVMFVTFGVMNVFIGMIVDKVTTHARQNEEEREKRDKHAKLQALKDAGKAVFGSCCDRSIGISASDLKKLVEEESTELKKALDEMNLPVSFTPSELVYMLDNNGDGQITVDELVGNFKQLVLADDFEKLCLSQTGINEVKYLINRLRQDLLGAPEHPGAAFPPWCPLFREMEQLINGLRQDMHERFTAVEQQLLATRDLAFAGGAAGGGGPSGPGAVGGMAWDGTGGTGGSGVLGRSGSRGLNRETLRAAGPAEPAAPSGPGLRTTATQAAAATQAFQSAGSATNSRQASDTKYDDKNTLRGGSTRPDGENRLVSALVGANQLGGGSAEEPQPIDSDSVLLLSDGNGGSPRLAVPTGAAPERQPRSMEAHSSANLVPLAPAGPLEGEQIHVELCQEIVFDEDCRLGFEVIWSDPPWPSVGAVHDGLQASRRGLQSGDQLIACNNCSTRGKSRGEILDLFKKRPLTLTIARPTERNAIVENMATE